ncbi:MAG: energy transducer TonB [Alphaproteobacteria bacterium]|nr:energy transducer TonB [Alphaproteobacteria bacterium]MBU2084112.1 energy transducer TonB [Alphaproteobacteria bacterium]MBU2144353.1 energy transducer TonB [Alphaproteobacteria bacterium]MBU2196389.1 energy transducer TonB [Alphaproteobacteria bacterium]
MKLNAKAFCAAILVTCLAGGVSARAQISPPEVEGGIVAVMPVAISREGFSGCCLTRFKVGRSGKPKDISADCTTPILRDAAVEAIRSTRFNPSKLLGIAVNSPVQSQLVAFEQAGEDGICRAGDDAWAALADLSEEAFPFLSVNMATMAPYADAAEQGVGIARGWADYYTVLDFVTPCGPSPAYKPPVSQSKTINTMGWDALRQTGAAFEKVFAWMNCRDDMLAAYGAQAAEWHAAHDSTPPDAMEHWVGGVMDKQIRAERGRYDVDRQQMIAYGGQIVRREQALRQRDAAREDDASSATTLRQQRREVVPTYRAPQTLRREWTAADQFFYERGPGAYQACLDNAATYGARQACLSALHGSE